MHTNQRTALLERDRELEELDRLADDALGGAGVMALVEGAPGVGKTCLLAAARERAVAIGFRALAARATELERELAFGVVRELLQPLAPAFEPPADVSFAALDELFELTAAAASEQPLVLEVDDLHSCDRPSLRVIAYLQRRLAGLPVLLIAAARMTEPGADLRLLGEIAHDPAVVRLHPRSLSPEGVARL